MVATSLLAAEKRRWCCFDGGVDCTVPYPRGHAWLVATTLDLDDCSLKVYGPSCLLI
jgi:hypothetical protein